MPVNGFLVNSTVQKYNYESLENYNTPDFSTSLTYQVGDYVMYQGKLYKCTTEITTGGAWDSTKWSLAILSDDVSDLESALTETQSSLATVETTSTASRAYAVGELLVYGNRLYKVASVIAAGATLTPGTNIILTTVATEIDNNSGSDGIGTPSDVLTKAVFGNGAFSVSRYSRRIVREGNKFITTHQSGAVTESTRYNINLFGDTVRVVSGTSLTFVSGEEIPIAKIGTQSLITLARDYPTSGSSVDGLRVILLNAELETIYNTAATSDSNGAMIKISLSTLLSTYPTAVYIAIYYYSRDASTHTTYIGIE